MLTGIDRAHFLAMAATVMRRVLVECARERRRLKRGGDVYVVEFDEDLHGVSGRGADLIALDEARSGWRRSTGGRHG